MVDNSLLVTAGWQNNVLNSHTSFLKYLGTFFHDGNQLLLFDQEKLKLCSP